MFCLERPGHRRHPVDTTTNQDARNRRVAEGSTRPGACGARAAAGFSPRWRGSTWTHRRRRWDRARPVLYSPVAAAESGSDRRNDGDCDNYEAYHIRFQLQVALGTCCSVNRPAFRWSGVAVSTLIATANHGAVIFLQTVIDLDLCDIRVG